MVTSKKSGLHRVLIMEMLYYTVAAIFLYVVSDWILNRIEIRRGARFENRSLVFFAIILVLSVALFNLIQQFQPVQAPSASDVNTGQGPETPQQ
jgi:predicted PurR-regulated permease PerM